MCLISSKIEKSKIPDISDRMFHGLFMGLLTHRVLQKPVGSEATILSKSRQLVCCLNRYVNEYIEMTLFTSLMSLHSHGDKGVGLYL